MQKLTKNEIKSIIKDSILDIDKGLGDTIARAIDIVTLGTVRPCGGCEKRKDVLNKKFPYTK